MASLMEDFIDVLERENEEYQRLTELSNEKKQIIKYHGMSENE